MEDSIDDDQLMPIQVFMIIWCVALAIVIFGAFICLIRCYRDLRGSLESQKVWPKSNPLFNKVAIDALPA